jgi:hypothetical protein
MLGSLTFNISRIRLKPGICLKELLTRDDSVLYFISSLCESLIFFYITELIIVNFYLVLSSPKVWCTFPRISSLNPTHNPRGRYCCHPHFWNLGLWWVKWFDQEDMLVKWDLNPSLSVSRTYSLKLKCCTKHYFLTDASLVNLTSFS